MPRPRRAPRARRPELTEGEELWALGTLDGAHPEYIDLSFFTAPERLRSVWHEVHGESVARQLAEHGDLHAGEVFLHGARVAWLTPEDVELLLAGSDPWAEG
jgi:hypothetical protein